MTRQMVSRSKKFLSTRSALTNYLSEGQADGKAACGPGLNYLTYSIFAQLLSAHKFSYFMARQSTSCLWPKGYKSSALTNKVPIFMARQMVSRTKEFLSTR